MSTTSKTKNSIKRSVAVALSCAVLGSSAFSPVGAESESKETVRRHSGPISSAIIVGSFLFAVGADRLIEKSYKEYKLSTLDVSSIEQNINVANIELRKEILKLKTSFTTAQGECLCDVSEEIDPRVLLKVVQTINFVFEKVPIIRRALKLNFEEQNSRFYVIPRYSGVRYDHICESQDCNIYLNYACKSLRGAKKIVLRNGGYKDVGEFIESSVISTLGKMFAERLIKVGAELDQTGVDTYLQNDPAYSAYVGGQQYNADLGPYLVSSSGRRVVLFADILRDYCNGVNNPIIQVAFKSYLDDLENDIQGNVRQCTMLNLNDRIAAPLPPALPLIDN